MNWDDIDDVLYDGTKLDIQKAVCPECKGMLSFNYTENIFKIECCKCGHLSVAYNSPLPNCVKFFGNQHTI